jgi:hypothetical protein
MLKSVPEMKDENRRPMFLIISAERKQKIHLMKELNKTGKRRFYESRDSI